MVTTPHIYMTGRRKVLITAPHAEEHKREGRTKHAEKMTGQIARYLAEEFSCHALFTNGPQDHDPNFDASSPFKDKIGMIVKARDIRLVIDLHQLHPKRTFLFVIGTNDGKTLLGYDFLTPLLKSHLTRIADDDLCLVNPEFGYAARRKTTIARHVAETYLVPAIQLEINTQLHDEHWQEVANEIAAFIRQVVPLNRASLV